MHTLFIYLWLLAPGGEKKTPLELRLEKTQARLQEEAKRGKCPIEMHKIEDYLRQVGVSVQDIVIAVVMSSLMLCLVFTFLFVGMGAFMEGHVEAGQAAINSLITGGAAVGANLSSSGTADSDQKLRKILGKVMELYKQTRLNEALTFSLDEGLDKASKFLYMHTFCHSYQSIYLSVYIERCLAINPFQDHVSGCMLMTCGTQVMERAKQVQDKKQSAEEHST